MSTIEERVARGAAWLDANVPNWLGRIDVRELDLSSCKRCVCGQLYGFWYLRPEALRDLSVAAGLGFMSLAEVDAEDEVLTDDEEERAEDEYAALTAEWRRVITERRAAA